MDVKDKKYFVTAIGTDSGKTLLSAILAYKLSAKYWKPVQCGFPADSDTIRKWLGSDWPVYPESYRLETPVSPHLAANIERIQIEMSHFSIQASSENLVVEGAGGLLVPLNQRESMADLIEHLKLPIVLVVNHYLGSINHALLTIAEIKFRKLSLAGIIFNGDDFQKSEDLILSAAGCSCWLRLVREPKIDLETIIRYSNLLKVS